MLDVKKYSIFTRDDRGLVRRATVETWPTFDEAQYMASKITSCARPFFADEVGSSDDIVRLKRRTRDALNKCNDIVKITAVAELLGV